MGRYLVSFDTDRIKEFLFATNVLTDIREASGILDRLNNRRGHAGVKDIADVVKGVYPSFDRNNPHHCIYAAGGSALMVLPDSASAEKAVQAVERLYRTTTVTSSITGVAISLTNEVLRTHFGEKVREAAYLLQKRKAEKGRTHAMPIAPYVHFCDACAQLPASYPDNERGQLICRACQKKRPAAGGARRGLWEKLTSVTGEGPLDAPENWVELLSETIHDTTHQRHCSPENFDDIGESAGRHGYIALIYADGNRMGQVLEQLKTAEEYSRFARLVDDLLLRVTYRALMEQVQSQPNRPLFEVLLAGGDDLMIVIAPDLAFDVVVRISRAFEQYSRPLVEAHGMDCLSMGTGLVIAHARYPIAAMQRLATDLQKRAKRRSFETGGGSAVDFAVVTAAGSEDLDRIRDEVLTEKGFVIPPGDAASYRLTQRPYTLREMETLLEHVRKLKESGFPHSQLQAMYEGLFHSPAHASLATLQTLVRVRKNHRHALREFFHQFSVQAAPTIPPWRTRDDGSRDTALGDLVEIYPFL